MPRARSYKDGVVTYARGTREALKALSGADLMGFTLPRRYGGLNLPTILYTAAIEMVSRADAALMTIFGLQDIAETINSFASEDQKQRYLPKFCLRRGDRRDGADRAGRRQRPAGGAPPRVSGPRTASGGSTASSGSSPTAAATCCSCSRAPRKARATAAG